MAGRLEGKVALVTGAAQGIGRGIAERFGREGARVGVLDVSAGIDDTAALVERAGGRAIGVSCDLRDPLSVQQAVAHVVETLGPVDVVVNNAAVMPSGRLHETSVRDWNLVFDVNVRGAYFVCREVLPSMIDRHAGSIIHMASVTGMLGLPGLAAYSATKAALIGLTRAMSTDYAHLGIRVNSVSPGTINSPMLAEFLAKQTDRERLRREFDEMHPIGRVGEIDEVARVVVFLASDEASFVTGANYTVDGGLSVRGEQPQD